MAITDTLWFSARTVIVSGFC